MYTFYHLLTLRLDLRSGFIKIGLGSKIENQRSFDKESCLLLYHSYKCTIKNYFKEVFYLSGKNAKEIKPREGNAEVVNIPLILLI